MAQVIDLAKRLPRRPAPSGIGATLCLWHARICARRDLREAVLHQPDSVLEDAGLTRRAAAREAAKPFWRA